VLAQGILFDAAATIHHDPGSRLFFFNPSLRGAALIASTTTPRPTSFSTLSVHLAPPCLAFFVSSFDGDCASSCFRATLRPNASSNSVSISSVAAVPRLRFLRALEGEVAFDVDAGSATTSRTGVGCVVGDVVSSFDPDGAPFDGVACRRRHSSGLRCSSDSASPRVKNRAWGEPAKRAPYGSSARASFS
jgi:hypothetical protein